MKEHVMNGVDAYDTRHGGRPQHPAEDQAAEHATEGAGDRVVDVRPRPMLNAIYNDFALPMSALARPAAETEPFPVVRGAR
jgi:hypothetical protein